MKLSLGWLVVAEPYGWVTTRDRSWRRRRRVRRIERSSPRHRGWLGGMIRAARDPLLGALLLLLRRLGSRLLWPRLPGMLLRARILLGTIGVGATVRRARTTLARVGWWISL